MNTSGDKPLLYVLLGVTGSGRREILADVLEAGITDEDRPYILLPESEPKQPLEESLPEADRWRMHEGAIQASVPEGVSHVFLIADGRANPVDQLEALKPWIHACGLELARIFTVVHCKLTEEHPELIAWHEACIHFSDVVLLNHRAGVANKWMSDFQARFKDACLPCLFEMVKAGHVKNPSMLLEPEARRLSQYFDPSPWDGLELEGVEIGFDDDETPAEIEDEDGELPVEEAYFTRMPGGRRVKEIPDVSRFLD